MSLLTNWRSRWPSDFAMEPEQVYRDKEAERAGQLVEQASQEKYGTPDPSFSFSHLSDFIAQAGESAGRRAGLPQYSEANPPPWAEGAASHAPQAAPNITAGDITSGRWQGPVGDYLKAEVTAIGKALNAPYEASRTLSNIVLGQGGTDKGVETGADGQPIRHGGGLSGVLEGWKGQLTQSPLETWQRASEAGAQADRSIQQRGIGGINPQILGQPVFSTVERTLGDPLLATGGGEALGVKGLLKLGGSALVGSLASGYANDKLPQDMNPVLRTGLVIGAGGVAGAGAYNADALAGVGKKIFTGTGPLAGEAGSFDFGKIGKVREPITSIDTPADGGGLHAPGLDPVKQRLSETVTAAEQALPDRAAANQALHGQQGSTYREELARLQAAGVDDLTASRVAAQLTEGMRAEVKPARYVINQADVPDLVSRASAEYAAGNINDFEHRRIMDILREADSAPRPLGPQHEIDLFRKTYGLDTVDQLNANGPTFAPKNEYPTMALPGLGPETSVPPMRTVGGSEQLAGEAAAASTDTRGAAGWKPDPLVPNPNALDLSFADAALIDAVPQNVTPAQWDDYWRNLSDQQQSQLRARLDANRAASNASVAQAGETAGSQLNLQLQPSEPSILNSIPEHGARPIEPMTTEALTNDAGRAAQPQPGIYDASRGWGPATPAELADPGVMASRRALVEKTLGVVDRSPDELAAAREIARQDSALAAARNEADQSLIRADPSTLTSEQISRRDTLLSMAEPGPSFGSKIRTTASEIANTGIVSKAGGDVSYVLRQAAPLMFRNLLFGDSKAVVASFRAMRQALKDPATAEAARQAMREGKYTTTIVDKMGVKLNFLQTKEGLRDTALVRDPLVFRGKYNPVGQTVGRVYKYTENANELFLDTMRYKTAESVLDAQIQKAAIEGTTVSPERLAEFGRSINHASGRGTGRVVDWLSSAPVRPLFSAQNLMAKPQMLWDMIAMGGDARKLAIQNMIGYGASWGGLTALAAAPAAGAVVGLDLPHAELGLNMKPEDWFGLLSGDFGRARVGENTLDFSGGGAGNLRSAAQLANSWTPDSKFNSKDVIDSWGRGKLSPFVAFLNDNLREKSNYDKTPIDWKSFGGVATQLNNAFGTLSVNDVIDAGKTEMGGRDTLGGEVKGALSTFVLGALATLGAGMNSGLSPREARQEAQDAATARLFPGRKYDGLLGDEKAKVNQDATVKGFDSQVQNDPANAAGKFQTEFDQEMKDAQDNFTTTGPDGQQQVTNGIAYRHAWQDALKSRNDKLHGAGLDKGGQDAVLNGWYDLYDLPGIKKQLQNHDYSQLDQLQEEYTAAHPEIVDKLAKSVGAHDDAIAQEMRQAAAQAKQYYAIPKYRGLDEATANRADAIIAAASSMTTNGQAASRDDALGKMLRNGKAVNGQPVTMEDITNVHRATTLGTNPERKAFQADPANHWFAVFYKGADETAGDVGPSLTGGSSTLPSLPSLPGGSSSSGGGFRRAGPTPVSPIRR